MRAHLENLTVSVQSLVAGVVATLVAMTVWQTRHSPAAAPEPERQPERIPVESQVPGRWGATRWRQEDGREDYTVIERRRLFYTSITELRSARVEPNPRASELGPGVSPPAGMMVFPPDGPENELISAVGIVTIAGERQVLIEDVGADETRFIRPGEEAFGYRLLGIGHDEVILAKHGKEYRLALGANKPDRLPRRPPRPAGERPRDPRQAALEIREIVEEQRFSEDHARFHEERERRIREEEERERRENEQAM